MARRSVPLPPPSMPPQGEPGALGAGDGMMGAPPPQSVPPHLAAMTRHDARLINLDTGSHVDSKGVEHKTHPGNPARVGPLTVVFASNMGHPPMRFGDHAKQQTNVHAHIRGKARPHPNALAIQIAGQMKLPRAPQRAAPEGSPQEEAAETPAEEATEQRAAGAPRAGERPPMRIPRPPRKVA